MMSTEERVRILREARPNSWLAFSEDESRVAAYGESYSQVLDAAESAGEKEPVIIKIPATWSNTVFSAARELPV
jgi:hypothetical protein